MKRSFQSAALILAMLVLSFPVAHGLAGTLSVRPESKLWLTGKSTVHAFESSASKFQLKLDHGAGTAPENVSGAAAMEALIRAKGVTSMDAIVAVKDLHSGKDGLDRNMYKALLAQKHPEIHFRMASYQVSDPTATGAFQVDAKGTLSIAGKDREITINAKAVREGDGIRLRGTVPLLMTQFGIKPPTMMMGTLRTSDEIEVHFDLILGSHGAAPVSKAE